VVVFPVSFFLRTIQKQKTVEISQKVAKTMLVFSTDDVTKFVKFQKVLKTPHPPKLCPPVECAKRQQGDCKLFCRIPLLKNIRNKQHELVRVETPVETQATTLKLCIIPSFEKNPHQKHGF